ncbi:MAG: GGDEF domain-containing protein [Pseudomonadota bacterium]|nr:GGDEF domain-containing protein [Pseudomonadota bacterium]
MRFEPGRHVLCRLRHLAGAALLCVSFTLSAQTSTPITDAWAPWQDEIEQISESGLDDASRHARLADLQARLPADAPYPVQRTLLQRLIDSTANQQEQLAHVDQLRQLADRHADRDTAALMQIKQIFDAHADDNIEVSLHALDKVRLVLSAASVEVEQAMNRAYAYMYWDVGNFELALRHLLLLRTLLPSRNEQDIDRHLELGEIIARLYLDMRDMPAALLELDGMRKLRPEAGWPEGLRNNATATRASALRETGHARQAITLLEARLATLGADGGGNTGQRLRQSLAESWLAARQPQQALQIAQDMVRYGRDGSPYYLAEGQVLQGTAEAGTGRVDQGIASIQMGLDHFRAAAHLVALQRGLARKVAVLAAAGRPAEALAALGEEHALTMSLYDSNRALGVARLQVQENVAMQQQEIARLSADNALQEERLRLQKLRGAAWMSISLLGGGAIVLLMLLLRSSRRRQDALFKDSLTGAYNRHHFQRWRDAHPLPVGKQRMLALIDLDHFKSINDQYGHGGGDDALREVAKRLRAVMRDSGELFRWGGEEFLLIGDLPAGAEIVPWLHEMLRSLQPALDSAGREIKVAASIGCVAINDPEVFRDHFDCALRWSDAGLYLAKANGRARAVWLADGTQRLYQSGAKLPANPAQLLHWHEAGKIRVTMVLAEAA